MYVHWRLAGALESGGVHGLFSQQNPVGRHIYIETYTDYHVCTRAFNRILINRIPYHGIQSSDAIAQCLYICIIFCTSFSNYIAWKWQPKKNNHDLAPELAAYTLMRSFIYASHQCGRDSPTPITVYIRSRVGAILRPLKTRTWRICASDPQQNVTGQSNEMSPLVSMLLRTFLNPLKF